MAKWSPSKLQEANFVVKLRHWGVIDFGTHKLLPDMNVNDLFLAVIAVAINWSILPWS